MGCVRAKISLTGQLDRRQPGNYFKLCTFVDFIHQSIKFGITILLAIILAILLRDVDNVKDLLKFIGRFCFQMRCNCSKLIKVSV